MIGIRKDELKEIIREVIREELQAALVRTITVEKGPDGPGDPEKRVEIQEMSILDFIAQYLPGVEGRLLGMQSDVNKTNVAMDKLAQGLQVVAQTLLGMEQSARSIAFLSDRIHALELTPEQEVRAIEQGTP